MCLHHLTAGDAEVYVNLWVEGLLREEFRVKALAILHV